MREPAQETLKPAVRCVVIEITYGNRLRCDHLAVFGWRAQGRARRDVERPPARWTERAPAVVLALPYLMQMAYRFTFAGAESSRFNSPIPHVVSDAGAFATAMITALSATYPPLRTF